MNGLAIPPLYGISLFSGIAGLELGIQQIIRNARTICYVEGEVFNAQVLHKNMQKGILHHAPIYSNVITFPSVAHHFSQKVDFITAGFPCQPFSGAGSRKSIKDEKWLWDSILETISQTKPSFLFLENVSNLLNEWEAFDEISKSLSQIGFNIEWSNVRASDVGANHQRNRLFIFAYKPERLSKLILSNPNKIRRSENFNELSFEKRWRWESYTFWKGVTITNPNCQRPIKTNYGRSSSNDCSRKKKIKRTLDFTNSNLRYLYEKKEISSRRNPLEFSGQGIEHFSPKWWRKEPPFAPICRVDDGIPYIMDRLRSLGNAVVPLQASWAFYLLIQRAFNRPSKS